jgi:hypothetical protein
MNTTGRGLAVTSPQLIYSEDGKHCYAYSGEKAATTAAKIYLDFETKDALVKGVLQVNGPVDDDTPTVGATSASQIYLNDVKLGILKTDTKDEDTPGTNRWELILPPYSRVKVTMLDDQNEADRYGSMSFIGEVY